MDCTGLANRIKRDGRQDSVSLDSHNRNIFANLLPPLLYTNHPAVQARLRQLERWERIIDDCFAEEPCDTYENYGTFDPDESEPHRRAWRRGRWEGFQQALRDHGRLGKHRARRAEIERMEEQYYQDLDVEANRAALERECRKGREAEAYIRRVSSERSRRVRFEEEPRGYGNRVRERMGQMFGMEKSRPMQYQSAFDGFAGGRETRRRSSVFGEEVGRRVPRDSYGDARSSTIPWSRESASRSFQEEDYHVYHAPHYGRKSLEERLVARGYEVVRRDRSGRPLRLTQASNERHGSKEDAYTPKHRPISPGPRSSSRGLRSPLRRMNWW